MQGDHPFRIVKALDVLVRLGEVLRAVHVLQHVHVPTRMISYQGYAVLADSDIPYWKILIETRSITEKKKKKNVLIIQLDIKSNCKCLE